MRVTITLTPDRCHDDVLAQVLDAADFSKGPLARLWLKHHVPHGLHGFYSEQYFGPQRQ